MARNWLFNPPAPDRRAVELEQRLTAEFPLSPNGTRPAQDPTGSQGRSRNGLQSGPTIVVGRVVDSVAYARTYKVQCERGLGTVRCCEATHTGLGVMGSRQLNTYPIGTAVLVVYHPQSLVHYIIGAIPDWSHRASDGVSDSIVQGSHCGLQVDAAHNFPFRLAGRGGVADFSAGRPSDSLQGGEWGAINELGGRVFLDSFQVQVAVDEETGFFATYYDQYARLSGRNLDVRSGASLREDRDDEGELSSVTGYNPYPWEMLGAYEKAGTAAIELSASEAQVSSGTRTRLEPVSDRQLSITREREFHGYLGQGGYRDQSVPVAGSGSVHTFDTPASSLLGVSSGNRTMAGHEGIRVARSYFIVKSPLIPVPKRANRPESKAGDEAATNYSPCGLTGGGGSTHSVSAGPTMAASSLTHVIEPSAVLDLLAYAFNWEGLHPFHYHSRDWYLDEESELEQAPLMGVPPFANLQNNQYLPPPTSYLAYVDDRYGLVDYYANLAFWGLLPRGGICQLDGFGAEQRSSGGTQYHFTPGDLVLSAGRNVIIKAGFDVIIEGHNAVDVSATHKNVRIKAEDNLMLMGGNSGCGGVLIESKADSPAFKLDAFPDGEDVVGGVVIRAKNSLVAVLANTILNTTQAWGDNSEGQILFDAGTQASIISKAKDHVRYNELCEVVSVGLTVHEYWSNYTRIATPVSIEGNLFVSSFAAFGGDVISAGTISGVALAIASGTQVSAIDVQVAELSARDVSADVDQYLNELSWYTTHTDIEKLEFYFRSSAQCRGVNHSVVEPIWAQMARSSAGGTPAVWVEQPVSGDYHDDSSPFPGYDAWFVQTGYGLTELTLFDAENMRAVDRGDGDYEAATSGATTWVTLEGNWPIIIDPYD